MSAVRPRPSARVRVAAALAGAGLLLSACGGSADASGSGASASAPEGHDHGSTAASLSGPQDTYAGIDLRDPYAKPTFTLADTTGAAWDFGAQTAQAPTLLFFGYTRCPDVCPTTLADIAVALRQVDPAVAARVRVVFVTTDPANDTAPVLGAYLRQFDADLPVQFTGLTGTQEQIDAAQLSAGVPVAEDEGKTHSALLLLYGSDDRAHVAFDAGNTPADIAHDLGVVAAGS